MADAGIGIYHRSENQYCFEFPLEPDYFSKNLYDAMEMINDEKYQEAESILRRIIEACPDHIDAIVHLAITMKYTGRSIEASALTEQAVNIGKKYFPPKFKPGKHTLRWGVVENRGYLRACHCLGLDYLDKNDHKTARSIFNELLALNPNDNQGIRELAIRCSFELNQPAAVLSICDNFPNDTRPSVLWGRVLALFQLNKVDAATAAVRFALEFMPKAGRALLKKKLKKPDNLSLFSITIGGDDEAYYHWKYFRKFWETTDGALALLKSQIKN